MMRDPNYRLDPIYRYAFKMIHYDYRMRSPGMRAPKPRRRPAWFRRSR